jgi:hypothetical protein
VVRNVLQRAAGPGIVALIGLGFDAADFFGSTTLAYVAWAVAAIWALYAWWPTLRRWRPFTLAPEKGTKASNKTTPTAPTTELVETGRLQAALHDLRQERESLRRKVRELEMMSPEEYRARQEERRMRIDKWRAEIRNSRSTMEFTLTDTYIEMKPFMQSNVQQTFQYPFGILMHSLNTMTMPRERGLAGIQRMLLDEVARIEKEWGLV